jgi:hypothetical protein
MHDRSTVSRLRRHPTTLALLAAFALALSGPARAEEAPVERRYQLRFLGLSDAIAVATNICPGEGVCAVNQLDHTSIGVRTDAATQERIAKALREADVPPADQAFQLVLMQADRTGTGDPGPLPAGARKALTDLADFLPYTRYQLLGSAFVRTTRDASLVVEGIGGRSYEAQLRFRGDPRTPGSMLLVERFLLRLVPGDVLGYLMGSAAKAAGEAGRGAAAPAIAPPPRRAPGASTPPPAAAPQPTPGPTLAESLLDTSFSLRRGETVVVGTSKLDGNGTALVVLLTALP